MPENKLIALGLESYIDMIKYLYYIIIIFKKRLKKGTVKKELI